MTTLDELLSPEPTKDDNDVQHTLIGEFIKLAGMKDAAPGWYGETRQMFVHSRLSLVHATLQEAAKLWCHKCASSQYGPAECVDGVWRHVNLGHTEYGQCPTTAPCDAAPIHARLAKEKP